VKPWNTTSLVAQSDVFDLWNSDENFGLRYCHRERPTGDVWIGHRSAQASHLGNIAYLQRRRLKFDPDREEILPL